MALETWLIKLTTTLKSKFINPLEPLMNIKKNCKPPSRKTNISILAFEIAALMSKILQLWQSLTDKHIAHLTQEVISLDGVRKIVSNDDSFLLSLACAEMVENLRFVSKSVSRLGKRCNDLGFQNFDRIFEEFANQGKDSCNWVLNRREMEIKLKKMEKLVSSIDALFREIETLSELEHGLKKLQSCNDSSSHTSKKIMDLTQKISWQKQEVRYLRESSLWSRSYDSVFPLLCKSVFTILARIKLVFGIGGFPASFRQFPPENISRSLSVSATVYPSETTTVCRFASGPLKPVMANHENQEKSHVFLEIAKTQLGFFDSNSKLLKSAMENHENEEKCHLFTEIEKTQLGFFDSNSKLLKPAMADHENQEKSHLFTERAKTQLGFFDSNSKLSKPPDSTLGANGLALHYANLIILIERLVCSSRLIGVGADVRDDLYGMLPKSIRISLKMRLKSYSKMLDFRANDPVLADQWSEAITRILEWLAPLAHNMIKWQSERNFEQHHLAPRTNVLLLQTLFFANQAKTEAAITELLVGLNYIWRFEREENAKALLECAENCKFNEFPKLPS